MVRGIKKCICGVPVTAGVWLASISDSVYGLIGSIVLLAGLFKVCNLLSASHEMCMKAR